MANSQIESILRLQELSTFTAMAAHWYVDKSLQQKFQPCLLRCYHGQDRPDQFSCPRQDTVRTFSDRRAGLGGRTVVDPFGLYACPDVGLEGKLSDKHFPHFILTMLCTALPLTHAEPTTRIAVRQSDRAVRHARRGKSRTQRRSGWRH